MSLPTGSASIARIATATTKSVRMAEGIIPRTRSSGLIGVRRMSATIGRMARYPAMENSISASTMTTKNPTVAATGFGRWTSASTTVAAGPAKAMAAATARTHDARLYAVATNPTRYPFQTARPSNRSTIASTTLNGRSVTCSGC